MRAPNVYEALRILLAIYKLRQNEQHPGDLQKGIAGLFCNVDWSSAACSIGTVLRAYGLRHGERRPTSSASGTRVRTHWLPPKPEIAFPPGVVGCGFCASPRDVHDPDDYYEALPRRKAGAYD